MMNQLFVSLPPRVVINGFSRRHFPPQHPDSASGAKSQNQLCHVVVLTPFFPPPIELLSDCEIPSAAAHEKSSPTLRSSFIPSGVISPEFQDVFAAPERATEMANRDWTVRIADILPGLVIATYTPSV
jgi:hypothetical protein